MKLEVARGVFLVAALGVATAAAAAWGEPGSQVVSAGACVPRVAKMQTSAQPGQPFLMLMYSLGHAGRT
ncbi:hypothetical protein [Pseudomonas sp. dw_358]|uniref:hypothetical protein n=1 Tax=Pseudomonas sp. dw_358 TaxID=2720083 RepID=UPI001BD1BF2D|nr:hypothetical protein [Pseudomonas sp. dw_358]